MLIFAIGLGALGLFAWRRARGRRGFACGCGRHGFGRHRHGWHRRGGRRRWMIHAALERIDASPAQERAIIGELERLEERLHGAGRKVREQRGALADAVRGSELDAGALAGLEHELALASEQARAAVLEAVHAIHGLLDERQRQQLAAMLDPGGRRGPGEGGPYRA